MIRYISLILLASCTLNTKQPREPKLFRPNYDLMVSDLIKFGYKIEATDGLPVAVKQISDSISVKITIDEKLGILLREIWEVKFNKKASFERLNYFLLNHSSIIVTEMCDSHSDEIDMEPGVEEPGTYMNFNFFVRGGSGRFFQCQYGDEGDGSSLLQIVHDHPSNYGDENNPRFREVFKEWREILKVQEENERFSNDKSKHWRP